MSESSKDLNKASSTEVSPEVQEMLNKAAQEQAESEVSSIPFISPKGKKFSIGDVKLGTSLKCIILADIFDHAYYDRKYDPGSDDVFPPACFSIGHEQTVLMPHETAPNKQAKDCNECPKNEFGSSDNGKGKACRNGRRLLIASVDDEGNANFTDLAIINLSPTALKGFSKYVKGINNVKKLPVWAVTTVLSFDDDQAFPLITATYDGVVSANDIAKITQSMKEFEEAVSVVYDVSGYEAPDVTEATNKKKSKMS